jgi:hypothetical protein
MGTYSEVIGKIKSVKGSGTISDADIGTLPIITG